MREISENKDDQVLFNLQARSNPEMKDLRFYFAKNLLKFSHAKLQIWFLT